jgi:nitrite reductase/ring-hydroxylating ferredoxin subunit
LTDKEEDRDGDGKIVLPQDRSGYGCGVEERTLDTDPTNADTDGDGIADGMEVKGTIYDPDEQPFLTLLEDQNIWTHGGIGHGSNANAKDSDGDGLTDSQEYNGSVITYGDSNPCLKDSDNDGIMDPDEFVNCALNKDPNCSGTGVKLKDAAANNTPKDSSGGIDSDGDGLTNECEALLKTNPHEMDSDLDGVFDGDEILYSKYHVCKFDITKGESDPNNPDTDNDGLNDGMEMRYGTYAWNADSDGDCIPDGPSQVTTPDGQTISSAGEDANADGIYEAGVETNALSPDTDGDGLPDGMVAGLGEDRNCNGIRDKNADGSWAETDPRMPDSDFDGEGDYQEITAGGFPNYDANMGNATMGHQGCMNIAGDGSLASNGMMYLFGLLLIVNRVVSLRMRKERVK